MFVLPLARAQRASISPSFGRALDRLFDESFDRASSAARPVADTRTPSMDVSESDTAYTVVFDVPGVGRDQLKVSVEGRRVVLATVEAQAGIPKIEPAAEVPVADAKPALQDRVLYRERSTAAYARTVVLPAEVDQSTSQAKFDNGVLTLTLAKKVPAGATQLSIG